MGSNVRHINNLIFGNGAGITTKTGTQNGTLNADPQFINYQANGAGDYHLKSTSAAMKAGVTVSQVITDFDGTARAHGSAYDIGAYAVGGRRGSLSDREISVVQKRVLNSDK